MSETPPEEPSPPIESQSILASTKAALGVSEEQTAFDAEILMAINTAISTLNQVGVGPDEGLYVLSADEEWEAFIGTDPRLSMAKSYVHMQAKMLYDPPEVGFVLTSMQRMLDQFIWRLMVVVDTPATSSVTNPVVDPDTVEI